ncbi:MAG: sugar ABC transporter substrate-binding protein [Chloroflexota bacterium]
MRSRPSRRLSSLAWPLLLAFFVSACVSVNTGVDGTPAASGGPSTTTVAGTPTAPLPSRRPSGPAATSASGPPSIGFISLDETLPYVADVSAGIRAAALDTGVDLVECDSGWQRQVALDCATRMAEAGVRGVISFQPFTDAAAEICQTIGAVPTVGIVFPQGPCEVSRLSIDQAESGRLAGVAVGRFASERWDCEIGAYISLESSDADPDGRARMQGYRDGFEEQCPMPAVSFSLDGADRLITAQTQLAGLLDDIEGDRIVVVGLNEDAVLGAMAAATDAGRATDLWYSGQLADPSIREHIACDGQYIASVAQFPERFGELVVPTILAAIDGKDVPRIIDAPLQLVDARNIRETYPDTPACRG